MKGLAAKRQATVPVRKEALKKPAGKGQLPKFKEIVIGSACSGWCSELFAARQKKWPYRAAFACDNNMDCKTLCESLWNHDQWFDDVMDPEFVEKAPAVDFFVAGFPCQPYSDQGQHAGMEDERAAVIVPILSYIKKKKPKTFLLENVKGLLQKHPETMHWIISELQKVRAPGYEVFWKLLSAEDAGIPQNRPRVFIVGMRKDVKKTRFVWPEPASRLRFFTFFIFWSLSYASFSWLLQPEVLALTAGSFGSYSRKVELAQLT